MIIKSATRPTRCKLCLQDAEAEVYRHLRENRPCNQPGCPLRSVINAALKYQRNKPAVIFGTARKSSTSPNGTTSFKYPAMIHILHKKSKIEILFQCINNQFKRIKKIWSEIVQ